MATILLVDDRRENLRALEAVLEPLGHTLLSARSGDQALAWLLKKDVALILLDVMMPGLDGFVQLASHEIQEPLDPLAGFLEVIAREAGPAGEDVRLLLDRAMAQVDRMRTSLEKLTSSTRADQRLEEPEVVELDKVLDQAIEELGGELTEYGASVVRTPVPAVRGDFWQ